jgi:hypothetical protein
VLLHFCLFQLCVYIYIYIHIHWLLHYDHEFAIEICSMKKCECLQLNNSKCHSLNTKCPEFLRYYARHCWEHRGGYHDIPILSEYGPYSYWFILISTFIIFLNEAVLSWWFSRQAYVPCDYLPVPIMPLFLLFLNKETKVYFFLDIYNILCSCAP